jgi:hypothetical protein
VWRKSFLFSAASLFLIGATPVRADNPVFQNGPAQATLLELFTSEGCSSCPSAEEWFSALAASKALWKSVVPVAFHVDYWDDGGWKDPLSSQAYSNLQRGYARRWGSGSVYTPMFVKNGKEYKEWFVQPGPPKPARKKTGTLKVWHEPDGRWKVEYEPLSPPADTELYEAHIALLGFGVRSVVTAGENSGRALTHDFAVLGVRQNRMTLRKKDYTLETYLTTEKSSDALTERQAVAVWVTGPGGERVQAAGGFLPEEI